MRDAQEVVRYWRETYNRRQDQAHSMVSPLLVSRRVVRFSFRSLQGNRTTTLNCLPNLYPHNAVSTNGVFHVASQLAENSNRAHRISSLRSGHVVYYRFHEVLVAAVHQCYERNSLDQSGSQTNFGISSSKPPCLSLSDKTGVSIGQAMFNCGSFHRSVTSDCGS